MDYIASQSATLSLAAFDIVRESQILMGASS